MPHNSKTPASILTAPSLTPKHIVTHTPNAEEVELPDGGKVTVPTISHQVGAADYDMNQLTGVVRNTKRKDREARAKRKRKQRNLTKGQRQAMKRRRNKKQRGM